MNDIKTYLDAISEEKKKILASLQVIDEQVGYINKELDGDVEF